MNFSFLIFVAGTWRVENEGSSNISATWPSSQLYNDPSFRRNGNNDRIVQKKLQRLFGKMGLSRELLENGSGLLKQPI